MRAPIVSRCARSTTEIESSWTALKRLIVASTSSTPARRKRPWKPCAATIVRRICARVTVVDAVDTYLATYPASPVVLDVLGTGDADEIRAVVLKLVPDAVEIFFFTASVSSLSSGGRPLRSRGRSSRITNGRAESGPLQKGGAQWVQRAST
jgi:hypothetical protein